MREAWSVEVRGRLEPTWVGKGERLRLEPRDAVSASG